MSILLVFFDGVGIGPNNPKHNPISQFVNRPFPVEGISYDFLGGELVSTDATLGLEGLPQSATGQTSILTGINAPCHVGRHVNAFPTVRLRELINQYSLLKQVKNQGGNPVFANAYHPGYFARKHSRLSVSTWSWLAAGISYNNLDDLHRGKAISHDLTNRFMNRFGFQVPVRRPEQSGRILLAMLEQFDFIFFEYILTDVVGHKQDINAANFRLQHIQDFMINLLHDFNSDQHTVVLTSDHGNMENLSTNTHTRNPVPTIFWGKNANEMARFVHDLTDITPAILQFL